MYSTTMCKLVDLISALRQSECQIDSQLGQRQIHA